MLDLSLAQTYVPVCLAVCKTGLLCTLLTLLHALGVPRFNANVAVALLLFVDRTQRREYILNSNTLAAFAFAGALFNEARAGPGGEGKEALGLVLDAA